MSILKQKAKSKISPAIRKTSRMSSIPPNEAIIYLQTDLKSYFWTELSFKQQQKILTYHKLQQQTIQNSLFVYREVQIWKRAKHHDTLQVLIWLQKSSWFNCVYINSNKKYNSNLKVHIDQL